MNMQKLIARVRTILLKPREAWPEIAAEADSLSGIYRNYVLILAAVPVVCTLIGSALFGIQVPMMGTVRIGFGSLLIQALLSYGISLLLIYVQALIVESLAPTFGAVKDRLQGLKTVTYASTPVWVAGFLYLLPGLGLLASLVMLVALVYAIYLIKLGLPHTMKCPEEKSLSYTAVVVVISIVLSLVFSYLVFEISGVGSHFGAMPEGAEDARFDKDSPMGKLEAWSKKMEEAGERMESAQKSGDREAQQEAMQNMMGTLLGGDTSVEAITPEKLGEFLPAEINGMQRSDYSAERNQAMGVQVAQAEASYNDGDRRLQVEIIDMGGAKGILALAGFTAVGSERRTDQGYEKTYSDGGRMVNEKWNEVDKQGEYSIVIGERFVIKVEGQAESITALQALANNLDSDGLEDIATASSE
jgi:hypothetical protein